MPQIPQTTTCVSARTPLWRAGSTSGPATSRLHVCAAQPPGPAPGRAGLALRGEQPVRMLGHAQDVHRHGSQSVNQEVGAKHTLRGSGLHGCAAGIPSADLLHDFDGAQARVLHARAQGQFQAVAQRAQTGVAVGDTTDTYREFVVNASTDSKTFQILPDQRQSGIGGEVAGQLFDNKVGHVKLTFRVNGACGPSCLFQ